MRESNVRARALYDLPTTGQDEYPLEDDVTVLPITKVQPEEEKDETNANIWQSVHCNEGLGLVKPAVQGVLQVSERTDRETPLTTNKIVTE